MEKEPFLKVLNRADCSITVKFFHPQKDLNEKWVKARMKEIMRIADIRADELSVIFVDDGQMTEYNKSYLGMKDTTDVMAFPFNETNEEGKFYLGDIIISVETAEKQAKELCHSFLDEADVLMTHALLHLIGFDHTKDKGQMLKEQERIVKLLKKN
jgi:probable rRNA maturation factor